MGEAPWGRIPKSQLEVVVVTQPHRGEIKVLIYVAPEAQKYGHGETVMGFSCLDRGRLHDRDTKSVGKNSSQHADMSLLPG
jgi:hypothetical protein